MENVKNKFGDQIEYANSMYDSVKDVDALIICTEWSIFRTPDFDRLRKEMKNQVIFDGRNLYDVKEIKNEGFYYSSIGRQILS